jgi:MYXO-CTERM domain-containing protein
MTAITMLILASGRSASAQECETNPGGVLQTFPASNSHGVPRNGLVVVRYCPSEEPLVDRRATRLLGDVGEGCACSAGAECLVVSGEERCLSEIPTSLELIGDEVRLETMVDLSVNSIYVIEAPQPGGILRLRFTTGDLLDTEPPSFDGLSGVYIRSCIGGSLPASCPDDGREGFVAILSAPAAQDVAGRVNLEYTGLQIREQERIVRGMVRGDGTQDVTFSVFIATEELEGDEWEHLCFAMSVRDPYGFESAPEQTICEMTPEYSPFGSACSAAPGAGSQGLWPLIVVVLLFWRRRRLKSS